MIDSMGAFSAGCARKLRICSETAINLLSKHYIQCMILILLMFVTFGHGLWGGFPRADQLIYLHQIGQYSSFWDLLSNAPSWNRLHVGDPILFRPILYLQLATFYYLFGYHFILWQLASLILHCLVVLGLYLLLMRGSLRNSVYPFLLSALFGCAVLGSDLVLWHHISGYITFCALCIYSLLAFQKFLSSQKHPYVIIAILLGFLAEFTYELGVVYNFFIALTCLYMQLFETQGRNTETKMLGLYGFMFLSVSVLYPLISAGDLILRGIHVGSTSAHLSLLYTFFHTVGYTLIQITFWIGGLLLPTTLDIQASGRAAFWGIMPFSFLMLTNLLLLVLTIASLLKIGLNNITITLKWIIARHLPGTCAMILLLSYSLIIAYGRALPRGIIYVLHDNLYYAYIAYLILFVWVALIFNRGTTADPNNHARPPYQHHVTHGLSMTAFKRSYIPIILLACLALMNCYLTYRLSYDYHYKYSSSRIELMNHVQSWLHHKGRSTNAYFTINTNCSGNDRLQWFGKDHRL